MKRETEIGYRRMRDLSLEEVRACPAFAHLSDGEVKEVIETLKIFAKIAYDIYKNEQQSLDNTNQIRTL